MHGIFSTEFQLALLVAAVVSTCLAAGLLACEFLAGRQAARLALVFFAAVLGLVVAVALLLGFPLWLAGGSGSLGAVLLLWWLLQLEPVRLLLLRLAHPKLGWAALLLCSLAASRFLAAGVLASVEQAPTQATLDLADVPVSGVRAVTDKGRPIGLFHFKMHSALEEIQEFITRNEKDRAQLIRLLEANPASNCHGWVFAKGQFGIRDGDVAHVLSDNEYTEVQQPVEGDVAIYRRDDKICHCGVVRIVDKHAPVLVESKWGPLGVYLHAPATHPFGGECRFYRSTRANHTLALCSAASEGATATNASYFRAHARSVP